jgi:hypothetical protein
MDRGALTLFAKRYSFIPFSPVEAIWKQQRNCDKINHEVENVAKEEGLKKAKGKYGKPLPLEDEKEEGMTELELQRYRQKKAMSHEVGVKTVQLLTLREEERSVVRSIIGLLRSIQQGKEEGVSEKKIKEMAGDFGRKLELLQANQQTQGMIYALRVPVGGVFAGEAQLLLLQLEHLRSYPTKVHNSRGTSHFDIDNESPRVKDIKSRVVMKTMVKSSIDEKRRVIESAVALARVDRERRDREGKDGERE